MPHDVLPPDVIRILSFHGEAEVWIGEVRGRANVIPFEDTSFLMLRRGGRLEAALQRSCAVEVHARALDGAYSLRLVGRAHSGLPLGRHPDRAALLAWLPEGETATRYLASPFIAERIELVRDEAGDRVHYYGPTPASPPRPAATWMRAAWGGMVTPMAVIALVAPWLWLGAQGAEYPARPLALALAWTGGLAELAAVRLLMLPYAYHRWRAGAVRESEAPILTEALLAPGQMRRIGLAGAALSIATIGLLLFWDPMITAIAAGANGGILLAPAWALHLNQRRSTG